MTRKSVDSDGVLPNLVTIVGRGVPSNFEISVDGDIEMLCGGSPVDKGVMVSGSVAEGAIEIGTRRFRFSGQMANVRLVDWNGVEAPVSSSTPHVHVDYSVEDG